MSSLDRFSVFMNKGRAPSSAPVNDRPAFRSPQPVQAPSKPTTEVTGILISLRVYNNWAIADFYTAGNHIKIKGEVVAGLKENSEYKIIGTTSVHPTYGESLEVISAAPHVQLNERAIEKFLANNFKGVGEKTAKKAVQTILARGGTQGLEEFRQKILFEPWSIDWSEFGRGVEFLGKSEEASDFIGRDLGTRIGTVPGMNNGLIRKLSTYLYEARAKLGDGERTLNPVADAWDILAKNPYKPARTIKGYGFRIADHIGTQVGIDRQDPQRLAALVHFAIDETCNTQGHAFLTQRQVEKAIQSVDPRADVDQAIQFGLDNNLIVTDETAGGLHYYTPALFELERSVARGLCGLLERSKPLVDRSVPDADIQTAFRKGKPNSAGLSLDPSQIHAVKSILHNPSRLHILTGGPGCGKTALMETVVNLLGRLGFNFCAPTGKAAKVLSARIQSTGHGATTIHSLLKGSDAGWQVNKYNPLSANVLVVDESSMPSLELWDAVLESMNEEMHLIVVGDPYQLPSIQAGQVLTDMIRIPDVNHVQLNVVHRNSGGILDVVNEVRAGKLNPMDRDSVTFSHQLSDAGEDFDLVLNAYLRSVAKTGIENTLLLMSRRQGKEDEAGWNTTYANARLREICNPNAEKVPGSRLFVNDRIIIRKNMNITQPGSERTSSDIDEPNGEEIVERVVNGDTGVIMGYTLGKGDQRNCANWLRIKLDEGRIIEYPGDQISFLDHAYALTVHAAQGSEYQTIIGVFTPGMPGFVNMNMLMTGLSRARTELRVFGNDADLIRIAATPLPKRNSVLVDLVTENRQDCEQYVARRPAPVG